MLTCLVVLAQTEETCKARDLRTLFVKMLSTENNLNARIEEYKTSTSEEIMQIQNAVLKHSEKFNTLELKDTEAMNRYKEIAQNLTVFADFMQDILTKTDGGWSSWSNWTECSVTCLGGLTKRTRTCTNPEPSNFGLACFGKDEEVESCNAILCPDTDNCVGDPCRNGATCLDGVYTYSCTCAVGFTGKDCDIGCSILSCKDAPKVSSTYQIYPTCESMTVYCDQDTDGGGWIVIQRRKDGSVDFNLTWADYRSGFGFIGGEFWLGNDNIHALTSAGFNELRIDMKNRDTGTIYYAKYNNFGIKSENDNYQLQVGEYSGNASDYFSYLNRAEFATKDWDIQNWAKTYDRGWWYDNYRRYLNLNGNYLQYFYWNGYLNYSEMKIR